MPYQFTAAHVRLKGLANEWQQADISNVDINQLYSAYSRVVLQLTNTQVPGVTYLDLANVRGSIGVYIGHRTVSQWLASIGNASLPVTTQSPFETQDASVLYSDAVLAGYKIKSVDRSKHHETQLLESEKRDLLLQKPGLDMRQWENSLLVTVNGLVHRTVAAEEGLYVVDGNYSAKLHNDIAVGLLSFRSVGAVESIPITRGMLYKTNAAQSYNEYVMLKVPKSMSGKTPILVLGGYMHILDDSYTVTGDRAIRVNMNRIQLNDRYQDSRNSIDLSMLNIRVNEPNDSAQPLIQFSSDELIQAYLTLPQSFIVLMDTTRVFVRRHPTTRLNFPGRWETELSQKRLPLIGPLGRIIDHRALDGRYRRMLFSTPHYNFDRMYHTTDYANHALLVDNTAYGYRPAWLSEASLLDFGRYS